MKRKITAFAFGAKWGFLGASGVTVAGVPNARPPSNEASATLPRPTAQSWKKCRRVRRSRGSSTENMAASVFFWSAAIYRRFCFVFVLKSARFRRARVCTATRTTKTKNKSGDESPHSKLKNRKLLPRDELVEVQQHARQHRPRRVLLHLDARRLRRRQLLRVVGRLREARALLFEQPPQTG